MSTALRISVAANLVLAVLAGVLLWRERPAHSPTATSSLPPPEAGTPTGLSAAKPAAGAPSLPPGAAKPTPAAIAQLEQLGLPREVIVNALLADFHRRWDQRFAELEKRHAPRSVPEREYIELARLREADQTRALREALGEDGYRAWDKEQTLRVLNIGGVFLSPDEAEAAYRMQKEFNEDYNARQMAMEDGVADADDLARLHARAQEALDLQLEQLLGKARLEAMRGAADPREAVYQRYGDLAPTPDQAQAVVRIDEDFRAREEAMARRLRDESGDPATVTAELMAMNDAREDELRRIFGAEAYEATRRQNDPTFKRLTQFAEAWELGAGEIEPVYETLRAFHDQAERTRAAAAMREAAGHTVDWSATQASIELARQRTEAGLQDLIGARRAWRLKQNGVLTFR